LSLRLPQNLFTSHRLIEEDELIFRLNDQYRLTLLAGSDAPLPAALPNEELSPLQATPALARHLAGIYAHFVRLDDSRELLSALIQRIIRLAEQAPDGCVAAILLAPYSGYTAHHAINCALLAARISGGLKLDPEERKTLTGAALTMNLGSAEVQNLLATQNGPPSTLQRQILDIHPLLSSAMLREAKIDSTQWHNTVLMHHERRDGRGYSFGVKNADIPPLAQLLHLLDVVCAKLMQRSYRSSVAPKVALASLYAGTMEAFDTQQVAQLVKILGIYPPGSFVELENGERALVVKNGAIASTPHVVPILSTNQTIDTAEPGYHVRQGVSMRVDARHLPLFYQYWR